MSWCQQHKDKRHLCTWRGWVGEAADLVCELSMTCSRSQNTSWFFLSWGTLDRRCATKVIWKLIFPLQGINTSFTKAYNPFRQQQQEQQQLQSPKLGTQSPGDGLNPLLRLQRKRERCEDIYIKHTEQEGILIKLLFFISSFFSRNLLFLYPDETQRFQFFPFFFFPSLYKGGFKKNK